MAARPPPAPVPAATLLVVRDGPGGLEVLMVERHRRADFAAGALVFPGGKLDPGDAEPGLREVSAGAEALAPGALALAVAAIREAFEECGLLLARPLGSPALVRGERLRELGARYRQALRADRLGIAELAAREGLRLACDRLVPFAHWITPVFMRRRFDTFFFLTEAPADQRAAHDGGESVDSLWIRPAAALAAAERGERAIVFPTLCNLRKLGRSATVAEALAAARAAPVVTVMPRLEGGVLRIPAEADYGLVEVPVAGLRGA